MFKKKRELDKLASDELFGELSDEEFFASARDPEEDSDDYDERVERDDDYADGDAEDLTEDDLDDDDDTNAGQVDEWDNDADTEDYPEDDGNDDAGHFDEPDDEDNTGQVDERESEDNADAGQIDERDDVDNAGSDATGLCANCQSREIDYAASPHSVLCRECRAEFIKLRTPNKIKLFIGVICALFLFSLYLMSATLPIYRVYVEAGRRYKSREYSLALAGYAVVLERYSDSVPVIVNTASAAMKAQQFDALAYVLDTFLIGKKVNDADYAKVMEYFDFLNSYYGTNQEIENVFKEISETPEFDDKSDIQNLIVEKLRELLTREDINKTQVYFYMGNFAGNIDESIQYLREACDQDPRVTYPFAYLGNALRRAGKLAQARQVFDDVLAIDACDFYALRGLSIVELLEGRKSEALDIISRARSLAPYGQYVPEAYIIALVENGLREEAEAYLSGLESEGYQFERDLHDYLNGDISLKQYYAP